MKLDLPKEWFESNIPHDNYEVGAIAPEDVAELAQNIQEQKTRHQDGFLQSCAFGVLLQLLRRERRLTIDQLSDAVQIPAIDLLRLEMDPNFIPKPNAVTLLSSYFGISHQALFEILNLSDASRPDLRNAVLRLSTITSGIRTLSNEEQVAMTEFLEFLAANDTTSPKTI